MNSDRVLKLAVLSGDGIGAEVTHAALPIFAALNIPVELQFGDIGWSFWQHEGNPVPDKTWHLISQSDAVLLGAITSKPHREAQAELAPLYRQHNLNYLSPIIQLRQKLDLFANVRPCFSIKEDKNPFNFCLIRENTEGLYSGFDYHPVPAQIQQLIAENPRWNKHLPQEISCALRLQTQSGLTRLFRYAFQYASTHHFTRVTFADKPNVLRQSSDFARTIFESVACDYPQIQADILNVDAVALWLIRKPAEFGVIVAENMFGDILSDVGAGIMGGLGLAPSANIGERGNYFEPVHGSGPNMQAHSANPGAMFLTIAMLLNHFGYQKQAEQLIQAVRTVVNTSRYVTYDLGGHASTEDMAKAIIDQCEAPTKKAPVDQLEYYNCAEISDALDACGIAGALLNMKPLATGLKLVGPAYTIQYAPNEEQSTTFKNAANYIDEVPARSVIVIDNNGQEDCTVWGDILTQVAIRNDIAGTIVNGAVRDVEVIRATGFPLFCTAIYMRSGKNRVHKHGKQCPLMISGITINPGDIIFADDHGVLVIPQHKLQEVLSKVEAIRRTEDQIKNAIQNGSTLAQARDDFRYDMPWLDAARTKDD